MRRRSDAETLFELLWALVVLVVFLVAYFRDWRLEQLIFWGVLVILADNRIRTS